MPHTYKFADAEQTTVVRDDGATFPWQKGAEPGAVGAQLGGFVGEDYRTEGCPMPAAFGARAVADKGKLKLKLKLRKSAGKTKAGKKWVRKQAKKGKRVAVVAPATKAAKPVDADMHPPKERKPPRRPRHKAKVKKGRKHK